MRTLTKIQTIMNWIEDHELFHNDEKIEPKT